MITKTEARLWTDGRYFIQAAAQLEGTTVELMKMGEPGVPEMNAYIEEVLKEGETLDSTEESYPLAKEKAMQPSLGRRMRK